MDRCSFIFKPFLLLLLVLIALASNVNASLLNSEERAFIDRHGPISLAVMYDFIPFSFVENGQHTGLVADLVKLLENKADIQIKIEIDEWANNLRKLEEKEVDAIADISYRPNRAHFSLFTTPYFEIPTVIFTRADFGGYRGFEDFSGKRVGVLNNIFYLDLLKAVPGIDIVEFPDYEHLIKAVAFGSIDASIQNLTSAQHYATRHALTNIRVAGEFRIGGVGREDLRFGVQSELVIIHDILQKAMDAITSEEWRQLSQRWTDVVTLERIKQQTLALTPEEREYVRQNPVIRVQNEANFEPYNYNENGFPTGHSIDLIRLLAARVGLEVEPISGHTWSDFMQMMAQGELDVMMNIAPNESRQEIMAFTGPYIRLAQAVYQHKDQQPIQSPEDFIGKTLALPDAFYNYEFFKNQPDIQVIPTEDSIAALILVSTQEADATLELLSVANHLSTKYGIPDLRSNSLQDTRFGRPIPLHIGVRKDDPMLKTLLQKSMDTLTEQEKRELQERWISRTHASAHHVHLTREELEWLDQIPALRICAISERMPYERIDQNGQYYGAIADIIEVLTNNAGLTTRLSRQPHWQAALDALENNLCDFIANAPSIDGHQPSVSITSSYYETPIVIATRQDAFFINNLDQTKDQTFAVLAFSEIETLIRSRFPDTKLVSYPSAEAGLDAVRKYEVFGYIDSLPSLGNTLNRSGRDNLKIGGQLDIAYQFHFAVQSQHQLLLDLLNKALLSITDETKAQIEQRWMQIAISKPADYRLIWQIGVVALLIIIAFIIWNIKLAKLNIRVQRANTQLLEVQRELEIKNRQLEQLAITDRLTRLYNRMRLEKAFEEMIDESEKSGRIFSVLLMDIDFFKRVNDTYGHLCGDAVLTDIASILKGHCSANATLARWGGEEFMVICPDMTLDEATTHADMLRQLIADHQFPDVGSCTVSIGVTQWQLGDKQKSLTLRADTALYHAKEQGRNRVCALEAGQKA
ncbi:hypothetical protein DN062_13160 [Nitrincola tibetensis]|uniref:GGDEF domain-containing protein n=1 Tax=Nitrincola tibetensis TaxID=2219697 RepID=A0A364NKG9_9GAMM|nr:transporter substrate-binding domain-containing protein [Nitrincola tibetensis]RAU17367.1 hypothetical protein DN062_13160 [Nitrincola tibetensis]